MSLLFENGARNMEQSVPPTNLAYEYVTTQDVRLQGEAIHPESNTLPQFIQEQVLMLSLTRRVSLRSWQLRTQSPSKCYIKARSLAPHE